MSSISWIELVQQNTARYGELVAGIDPSLSEIPSFLGKTTLNGSAVLSTSFSTRSRDKSGL